MCQATKVCDTNEYTWCIFWKPGLRWQRRHQWSLQTGHEKWASAGKKHKGTFGVIEILHILTVVMATQMYTFVKTQQSGPASVAQWVRALCHAPKGHGFNYRSRHVPRLQIWSLVLTHSLSLSLHFSLYGINKYKKKPHQPVHLKWVQLSHVNYTPVMFSTWEHENGENNHHFPVIFFSEKTVHVPHIFIVLS